MRSYEEFEPYEPEVKVIYLSNTKEKTAGYDKYVFEKMMNSRFGSYKNKRTGGSIFLKIENGKPVSQTTIYYSVVEFFVNTMNNNRFTKRKQWQNEFKQITRKYPEYFI